MASSDVPVEVVAARAGFYKNEVRQAGQRFMIDDKKFMKSFMDFVDPKMQKEHAAQRQAAKRAGRNK